MTISSETSEVAYTGNGATTEWPVAFYIPDEDSLKVYLREISSGDETEISSSDYSVTGIPSASVTVTYPLSGSAVASTHKVIIQRVLDLKQTTTISNQPRFYPATFEEVWDRLTMVAQQLSTALGRAVALPKGETNFGSFVVEDQKIPYWDEATRSLLAGPTVYEVSNAQSYAEAAEEWAVNPEDVEVETGKYSAYHYSVKTSAGIADAINSAAAAASSADAANVSLLALGDALANDLDRARGFWYCLP